MNGRVFSYTRNRSSLVLAGSLLAVGIAGCASSSEPPRSPEAHAATIQRTECGSAYRDDATVRAVVDGTAVEGVTPLYAGVETPRSNKRLEGAVIRVRPMKGVTAEWLARALTCHGAGETLAQSQRMTRASDPFSLDDGLPAIRVRAAGDAFEIDVRGATPADAVEILSRARATAATNAGTSAMAVAPEL